MGTVLKVLGIVFVVAIVGIVALLVFSHQKGEATQEEFYAAVLAGDPEAVLGMLHPELRAQVDGPVLAVWMAAVKEHLGAFQGLSASGFSTSTKTVNGVSTVESSGTLEFEKGEGESELALVDGQIVSFRLTSDRLPNPWFRDLPDATLYEERGQKCLEHLLAGRVEEGLALMHESLAAKFEPETLTRGMEALDRQIGGFESVTLRSKEFEVRDAPELWLRYTVKGQASEVVGLITFKFTPWKGHLIAIDVPEG